MALDPFEPIVFGAEGAELVATVLPYGLTIHTIGTEEGEDFIGGPEHPRDHQTRGRAFLNPIIGRFANRLPVGKIDYTSASGHSGHLQLEEYRGPGVVLHGGAEGEKENQVDSIVQHGPFDRCYWQPIDTKDSKFFSDAGYASTSNPRGKQSSLIFAIESPDGDSGFPGQLRVETLLALVPGSGSDSVMGKSAGKLLIRYRAALASDGSVEATPFNMTHHWGFNMSASNEQACKAENGTVTEQIIQMYPPPGKPLYHLDIDPAMLATGKMNVTTGEPETFSNPGSHHWDRKDGKRISDGMPANGYDDFYVWGPDASVPQADEIGQIATEATKRMRVTSESAGRSVLFYSNQVGVQMYTAEGQPEHPADPAKSGGLMKQAHRKGGQPDSGNFKRSFTAIEFGGPHCGFLHDRLADMGGREEVLEKGQIYDNWVVCEAFRK